MLKLYDLNERVIQNKTSFTIHDRRFFSPKRAKTEEMKGYSIQRSFLSLQKEKPMIKTELSFNMGTRRKGVSSERLHSASRTRHKNI